MISAGKTDAKKIQKSLDTQNQYICGKNYGHLDDACKKSVDKAVQDAYKTLDPENVAQQEAFLDFVKMGNQQATGKCSQTETSESGEIGLNWASLTDKDRETLSKCIQSYVHQDKDIKFNYENMPYLTIFIPRAAAAAKIGGTPQPEDVPIPQSLRDYIKGLRDKGLDDLANLAKRLFRHGLGNVEPSSKRFEAAQPIADQVNKYVKEKLEDKLPLAVQTAMLDYAKAREAKDEDGKKKAKAKIEAALKKDKKYQNKIAGTYVVPKATNKAKKYKIEITEVPKSIMDLLGKYPAILKPEIMRLYGEALQKAEKADPVSVANALVKAVDDKLADEKDPKKMLDKLTNTKVDGVKTDESGKKAEEVSLKDLKAPKVPQKLIEALNAEGSTSRKYLLNFIWRQIKAALDAQGIKEVDSDLAEKIVRQLAQPKDKGGLQGMPLAELAAQEVKAVDSKKGVVVLETVPKEAYATIAKKLADLNIPLSHGQLGATMVHQKITEIFIAARKAGSKVKPVELAAKVDKAADNHLNPDKVDETDGTIVVRNFLGMEFDKFDENGNILLKYKEGFDPQKGGGDGRPHIPVGEGFEIVPGFEGFFMVGYAIGVERPEGDETSEITGAAAARGFVDFNFGKGHNIQVGLGWLGMYSPPMFSVGLPNGDRSVATSSDDGGMSLNRFNEASLAYGYKFGVKDDGSLESTTAKLGASGGLISAYMPDGTALGIPIMLDPFGGYQPFSAVSSRMVGIKPKLTLAFKPVKGAFADEEEEGVKITGSVPFGTAKATIAAHETEVAGGRIGGHLGIEIDGDGLAGTPNVGWDFLIQGGVQSSWGDKDEIPDAFSATAFAAGGSILLQPAEWLKVGFGGGGGMLDAELANSVTRFVVGGSAMIPIKVADGKVVLIPGLGYSYSSTSQDKQVAGTPREPGEEPAPNPGCEPGYDCPGPAVDPGEGAGGAVGVMPSEYDFWVLGNNIHSFNIMFAQEYADAPWLKTGVGLLIYNVGDHMTGNSDTAAMPRLFVGTNF